MMSCFQEMSVLSDLVETLVFDIWILFNISAAFSWKVSAISTLSVVVSSTDTYSEQKDFAVEERVHAARES